MTVSAIEDLREGVRSAYSAAALHPAEPHPFPVGRHFAEELGYAPELLSRLPTDAVEAFSGVSNVSIFADVAKGATVLDLGCGAAMDSLIAADRVGSTGAVIGLDFSEPMLARAQRAQRKLGLRNVLFVRGEAEHLPLADGSIDVAIVNGIFNLNPTRTVLFRELARVISPNGSLFAAELILRDSSPPQEGATKANWFA